MLEGDKYTVALMHEGAGHFKIRSDIGRRVPLTWTASGRLLVAGMTDETIRRFVPPEDFVLPGGAHLSRELFLRQVRQARAQGFYSCDSVLDTFTHCFAAPVRDESGRCRRGSARSPERRGGVWHHGTSGRPRSGRQPSPPMSTASSPSPRPAQRSHRPSSWSSVRPQSKSPISSTAPQSWQVCEWIMGSRPTSRLSGVRTARSCRPRMPLVVQPSRGVTRAAPRA